MPMLLVFNQFVHVTGLALIFRYGYLLESEMQLKEYLYRMNTISKVNCTRYTLEEPVPYKHPLHDINSRINNGVINLNLFIEDSNVKSILKNDPEVFVKFEFTIFESKIFDNETLGFICKMHRAKDNFLLKIDKVETFNQFLRKEYSNLINIFTFRESLNDFNSEDEYIKYLGEELKKAIKDREEENDNCLDDLIKNFIDHTKDSNSTINSQFETFMKFKKCLFNSINFDLDKSLRFDMFDGENFMKITRCLKINICGYNNLEHSNTEVELFDKHDNKVECTGCLIFDTEIVIFLTELVSKNVSYFVVTHKVNGKTRESDRYFL